MIFNTIINCQLIYLVIQDKKITYMKINGCDQWVRSRETLDYVYKFKFFRKNKRETKNEVVVIINFVEKENY